MKLSKSAQELLDAIDGVRRIKHNKYHDRAIVTLKAAGIIYKDENDILRRVQQVGIELPLRTTISKRWTTAVWSRHAGKKYVQYVAYGDTRAESMDNADKLVELLKTGAI